MDSGTESEVTFWSIALAQLAKLASRGCIMLMLHKLAVKILSKCANKWTSHLCQAFNELFG